MVWAPRAYETLVFHCRPHNSVATPVKPVLGCCVLLVFASLHSAQFASAQEPGSFSPPLVAPLTAEQVVRNLIEMNSARAEALLAYEGTRTYRLVYRGFHRRSSAEMVVKVRYRSPATKEFTIVSQNGSRWIVDTVFGRLLAGEKEALRPENVRRTALDRENYKFILQSYENSLGDPQYVFSVQPRSNDKFLYRGQIWVDGTHFAVARIKVEPAKNPSFWIKHTDIEHLYIKIGGFWLPSYDHSVSQLRLGGNADLTIEYNDYKITDATPLKR
jgi:hypothetical protein